MDILNDLFLLRLKVVVLVGGENNGIEEGLFVGDFYILFVVIEDSINEKIWSCYKKNSLEEKRI